MINTRVRGIIPVSAPRYGVPVRTLLVRSASKLRLSFLRRRDVESFVGADGRGVVVRLGGLRGGRASSTGDRGRDDERSDRKCHQGVRRADAGAAADARSEEHTSE